MPGRPGGGGDRRRPRDRSRHRPGAGGRRSRAWCSPPAPATRSSGRPPSWWRVGRQAKAVVCDVTSEASVQALAREAAELGPVAVLVNNAGAAASMPVVRTSLEDWNRLMAVNATGAFLCTRAFLPGMLERQWGRVVNVASTAGSERRQVSRGLLRGQARAGGSHPVGGGGGGGHRGHGERGLPRLRRYRDDHRDAWTGSWPRPAAPGKRRWRPPSPRRARPG